MNGAQNLDEFDMDMKRMLEMTEIINLDGVPGLIDTIVEQFSNNIVQYLKNNFRAMIDTFDENDIVQYR